MSIWCEEQRRLMQEFADAVKELMYLHRQQFEALTGSDPDSSRFDLLIHLANEKKSLAKYAYLGHMQEHGCAIANVNAHSCGTGSS